MAKPSDPHVAVEDLVQAARRAVQDDARVLALYLFGSFARGDEHAGSDVDLAVLFSQPQDLAELVRLECRLEDAIGRPVDLIDLGKASAFLALAAIRGERIHCRDSRRCDEFDLYVLRRAGDLAPFEKERRRFLLDPEEHRRALRSAGS